MTRTSPRTAPRARRPHRPFTCGLFACIGLYLGADLARAVEVQVYEVSVTPAAGESVAQAALRAALIRATGKRDADSDAALAPLLADAQRYLRSSRPTTGGTLLVALDGPAVERAIVAVGRPLWSPERPLTLVALQPAPTGEEARRALELAAARRGLPISVTGVGALGATAGAAPDREAALAAAARLGAQAVLLGRAEAASAAGVWQWTLHSTLATQSWSGPLEEGVQHAADLFAHASEAAQAEPALAVSIDVAGISNLQAYGAVVSILSNVPGMRRVAIEVARADTARFSVSLSGGSPALAAALASNGRLEPRGQPSGDVLGYRYRQ